MSITTEKALRTFLMASPRPDKILVYLDNDQVHELAPASHGRTWASIAQSIVALEPVRLECHDEKALLRAARWGEEEEKKKNFTEALGIPGADTETARITHFANLLYRATEFSTQTAFNRMCDLFDRVMQRSDALEARLERMEREYTRVTRQQMEDALERAREAGSNVDPEAPIGDQMMGSFLQGMMQAQAERAASNPNGAKPRKGEE